MRDEWWVHRSKAVRWVPVVCQGVSFMDTMPEAYSWPQLTGRVQRGVWERDRRTGMGMEYEFMNQLRPPGGGEACVFNMGWMCSTKEIRYESGRNIGFHFHKEQDQQNYNLWWWKSEWLLTGGCWLEGRKGTSWGMSPDLETCTWVNLRKHSWSCLRVRSVQRFILCMFFN